MKNKKQSKRAWKGVAVSMVICFVAVIALAGSVIFRQYQREKQKELARQEKEVQDEQEPVNSTTIDNEDEPELESEWEEPEQEEEKEEPVKEEEISQTTNQVERLAFSKDDLILWPVDGNVLLNYSMDQTVYFATLDQYKYNPALIISGEVVDEVMAVHKGIVSSVEESAQTGRTVTLEMGNGYEAIYGQLKDVKVKEGAYVGQGQIIGSLNEPTKYYSVEGCNLYFQMLKDGEPVNPLEYLDT